jgi:hypothetical protein
VHHMLYVRGGPAVYVWCRADDRACFHLVRMGTLLSVGILVQ